MSMGRLLLQQFKRSDARHILRQAIEGFTEGFDTPDLLDAKAMMEEIMKTKLALQICLFFISVAAFGAEGGNKARIELRRINPGFGHGR